jgi:hypothetical protein
MKKSLHLSINDLDKNNIEDEDINKKNSIMAK